MQNATIALIEKNPEMTGATLLVPLIALIFLSQNATALQSAATRSSGGWRVALNLGREKLTTMPKGFASTGARFPLVMNCNFTDDGKVTVMGGNVRYTLIEGEVVKPVSVGTWKLSNNRDLSFSLVFPETMERNGVEFGPCEVFCEGLLYTKDDLDALDREFYSARSITDDVNAEVKEEKRRREAPKKWNFKTERWEKRYKKESIVSTVGKRFKKLTAGVMEERQNKKRPTPSDLSLERGQFPNIECDVFLGRGGEVRIKGGVIGKWGAEPISDRPASYYRASY